MQPASGPGPASTPPSAAGQCGGSDRQRPETGDGAEHTLPPSAPPSDRPPSVAPSVPPASGLPPSPREGSQYEPAPQSELVRHERPGVTHALAKQVWSAPQHA